MKIRPVGAELFLADGRHIEVNSRFSQICESAIKIWEQLEVTSL